MSPPIYYSSPLAYYHKFDKGRYPIIVGEEIEGQTFNTVEEWYAYPYKYEVMFDAMKFKNYLREISKKKFIEKVVGLKHHEIGRCHGNHNVFDTPLVKKFDRNFLTYLIDEYGKSSCVNNQLFCDLKNTAYSDNLFCHNYLCYKSFVVKNNKLIGIRNWQYAGFFPPEFEDIKESDPLVGQQQSFDKKMDLSEDEIAIKYRILNDIEYVKCWEIGKCHDFKIVNSSDLDSCAIFMLIIHDIKSDVLFPMSLSPLTY
ncbi:unnamed protein product [Cunninghamella echinulata]